MILALFAFSVSCAWAVKLQGPERARPPIVVEPQIDQRERQIVNPREVQQSWYGYVAGADYVVGGW
jgi:hypothetical protein